jgi:hypothetical protein
MARKVVRIAVVAVGPGQLTVRLQRINHRRLPEHSGIAGGEQGQNRDRKDLRTSAAYGLTNIELLRLPERDTTAGSHIAVQGHFPHTVYRVVIKFQSGTFTDYGPGENTGTDFRFAHLTLSFTVRT